MLSHDSSRMGGAVHPRVTLGLQLVPAVGVGVPAVLGSGCLKAAGKDPVLQRRVDPFVEANPHSSRD